jgi:hypothetical protein
MRGLLIIIMFVICAVWTTGCNIKKEVTKKPAVKKTEKKEAVAAKPAEPKKSKTTAAFEKAANAKASAEADVASAKKALEAATAHKTKADMALASANKEFLKASRSKRLEDLDKEEDAAYKRVKEYFANQRKEVKNPTVKLAKAN